MEAECLAFKLWYVVNVFNLVRTVEKRLAKVRLSFLCFCGFSDSRQKLNNGFNSLCAPNKLISKAGYLLSDDHLVKNSNDLRAFCRW